MTFPVGEGFPDAVVGGTTLIRPAIKSPNYVAGVAGWSINQDGSAEFNNLTIRGTFNGTDFIINSAGIFIYSGTPALGNLVGSWASAGGADAFGNAYPKGLAVSDGAGTGTLLDNTHLTFTGAGSSTAGFMALQKNAGASDGPFIFMTGPANADHTSQVITRGQSTDGTTTPAVILHGLVVSTLATENTNVIVTGGLSYAFPAAVGGTDVIDPFHSLGSPSATGWTSVHGRYRMMPLGDQLSVEFDIQLTAAAGNTAGIYTYANTLPAAYRPADDKFYPLAIQGTVAFNRNPGVKVHSTGAVELQLPGGLPAGNTAGTGFYMPLNP